MDKFKEIMSQCKCSVSININQHRDYYQSAETYLLDRIDGETIKEHLGEEIYNGMIYSNTIIELQFYPNTPISFYNIMHYDLDMVLDMGLQALAKEPA